MHLPILLLLLLLAATPLAATPSERLLDALQTVESNGNANAIGDGGNAVGILQIHPCVVTDVNRIHGTRYTLSDRLDPAKARQIARLYLSHYCKTDSDEANARTWNGGPKGAKKAATVAYWRRVKARLAK